MINAKYQEHHERRHRRASTARAFESLLQYWTTPVRAAASLNGCLDSGLLSPLGPCHSRTLLQRSFALKKKNFITAFWRLVLRHRGPSHPTVRRIRVGIPSAALIYDRQENPTPVHIAPQVAAMSRS